MKHASKRDVLIFVARLRLNKWDLDKTIQQEKELHKKNWANIGATFIAAFAHLTGQDVAFKYYETEGRYKQPVGALYEKKYGPIDCKVNTTQRAKLLKYVRGLLSDLPKHPDAEALELLLRKGDFKTAKRLNEQIGHANKDPAS